MAAREPDPLYAVFTMDCVPPDGRGLARGPSHWQRAERAMAAFAEGLERESLTGTFFIAPEALDRFEDRVNGLRAAEMELGMLCHPQLCGYQACLGSYGYDQQRDIIRIGKTIWQDRLGEDPVNFRPGFFSANDYTYQILCMEGFSQGSCSLPGRVDPEQFSVWRKTCPFAHHTDPLDRKAPGSMEFFEVPVTSDFEATATAPRAETFTPPHLRIEDPYTSQEAEALICKALDRAPADGVGVHTAVFVTHNAVGWGQAEDPHVERLRNLASLLRKVARGRGMVVVPAGLQAVHEQADRRWRAARAPWEGEDFA